MILKGAEAARYLARPDPGRAGLLIHGADAMRVALKREAAIVALIGPEGAGEMRLARMTGADLRRDPAALHDAIKATGFFPGPRVAFVEEATDMAAEAVGAALKDWRPGDAVVVVTAGDLRATSKLRKLFEGDSRCVAIAIYDEPPGPAEIAAMVEAAGLGRPPAPAMAEIAGLARTLDPGDLRQTLEKLALYKRGDAAPLTPDDIAAVAPVSVEAETDALVDAVAEGREGEAALLLRRLDAQGTQPVALCIALTRHFRELLAMAAGRPGAGRGGGWTREQTRARHARLWDGPRAEAALALLVETDLALRSAARAPTMAVIERAMIRLAAMARRDRK
jgi:DNA polymerase-3 subunit delta